MSTLTFAGTHNMVAFLEKPAKSNGFHEIIDFLNANQIHYALTVNTTIYISCIEQFWATAKVKTINGERQLQALVNKKKVIITETSIRSDLHLEDAGGTDCLPTTTIFEELARMGAKTTAWNEFSNTMASAIICLAINKKFNLFKYIFDAMKKQSRRKQRKETKVSQDETQHDDSVPTPSNDPPLSGEDRMQLTELMILCTNLQKQVLDLKKAKDAQAKEIAGLKKRVQKLERKKKSRTTGLKKLRKVGEYRRVESSEDKDSLAPQEDTSNQGRSLKDINKDAEVSLVDETQGRSDDAEMFDTDILFGNEVFDDMIEKDQDVIPKEVSIAAPSNTASEKSKDMIQEPVQSTATTAPSTIPKAKGITFRDVGESTTRAPTLVSSSSIKDKGKAKMDELEVPLKKNDQIALDEEMARNLETQIQAELIEEERFARKKEEEAKIALIESWDNIQDMMEADFELAQRLQTEEQGEIAIDERSRLFVELMNKRRKHFAMLRAEEKRRKPLTKSQKRNQMSTYLKNMGGYKYN
ncbi:hypothetical protein Tco_0818240 [Tanacetum coccineum]